MNVWSVEADVDRGIIMESGIKQQSHKTRCSCTEERHSSWAFCHMAAAHATIAQPRHQHDHNGFPVAVRYCGNIRLCAPALALSGTRTSTAVEEKEDFVKIIVTNVSKSLGQIPSRSRGFTMMLVLHPHDNGGDALNDAACVTVVTVEYPYDL